MIFRRLLRVSSGGFDAFGVGQGELAEYRNLMAHPDAELVVDGNRRPVHARTATAAEKAGLWPRIVAAYKGYGNSHDAS